MKKTFKITGIIVAALVLLALAASFLLGITPLSFGLHKPVYSKSGKVLDGYDVVSYFEGRPVRGNAAYSMEWRQSTWRFASAEHLNTFRASPERFVPQFGGYCTKAISTGFAAPGDPEVWLVRDEKLYIFASEEVKNEFIRDPESITAACNKVWDQRN
ncbi:MAG: hypothetical protein KDC61_03120 [Saprospiraceae bacterium]|nr:hypothetical protein [Saprospiraceae bacterium]MCB0573540.1 hypothetical protein [Saprospiraceae bacterium]MCB9306467.1 YHS domain protein [Lewinellaceae bacterium]MCB9355451.1 YHS domain protein [Lewinellaceae bacterium]